jgi:hypothetical protein
VKKHIERQRVDFGGVLPLVGELIFLVCVWLFILTGSWVLLKSLWPYARALMLSVLQ